MWAGRDNNAQKSRFRTISSYPKIPRFRPSATSSKTFFPRILILLILSNVETGLTSEEDDDSDLVATED